MRKRRCVWCGETLVVKDVAHTIRGPAVSFLEHPACQKALQNHGDE